MMFETLPVGLTGLCSAAVWMSADEKDLLPPQEVIDRVRKAVLGLALKEDYDFLFAWVGRQRVLQKVAEAILEALPFFTLDDAPGWMGQRWALVLQAGTWSDKLADACDEANDYLCGLVDAALPPAE